MPERSVQHDGDCPRTHQPCKAGSHVTCREFWDCIYQSQKESTEAGKPAPDMPPSPRK